jgi:hypothetical protein
MVYSSGGVKTTLGKSIQLLVAGLALASCNGGSARPSGSGGAPGGTGGSLGTAGSAGSGGAAGTQATGGALGGIDGAATGGAGAGGSPPNADGSASGEAGGASDAGNAGPFYPLDMNDVTILAPLPAANAPPVLFSGGSLADDGTAFVPRPLFERLLKDLEENSMILPLELYDSLQVVSVRFDLCDRHLPGACPRAEDARMRLVFQPISTGGAAEDAGFHAFYAIHNHEIPAAVAALRDLARSVSAQTGALRVSPALTAADPRAYATKLRAFVKRYGGETRLVRLTMNAQPRLFAQLRWVLRGVEKRGDAFVDIPIVGTSATSESVLLVGNPGYEVKPPIDRPPALLVALDQATFNGADASKEGESLAALASVDNPLSHTAETLACVACHVSTVLMATRSMSALVDPLTVVGRFTSRFDLSVAGGKLVEARVTRALGYVFMTPLISQRVANETAQVLTEIEKRYPAP